MAGLPPAMLSASAKPPTQQRSYTSQNLPVNSRTSFERDGLQPPAAVSRNLSASAVSFATRGSSLNPSPAPGAFSVDLRSQMLPSRAGSRADIHTMEKVDEDESSVAEQNLVALKDSLNREMKIKEGSENMLEALNTKKAKQTKEQRQRVEAELNSSNQKIKELRQKISEAQRAKITPATPTRTKTAESLFHGSIGIRSPKSASRSVAEVDFEEPAESATFVLAEILQALEVDGMMPEYYVSRANNLVDLFKRHPTLKQDLVWSIFGLRMQVMLLSESREVVASGYRMIRYAISDAASLKKIRSLNTDYLVTWSLIKDNKADVEREQALKFVRAFLDVEGGIQELSRAVVRTIAAVAETPEERLRPICLETLAEILVQDPRLLVASGGLGPLSEALADGSYKGSESLTAAFLFLLDDPQRRKYLRAGYELEVLFTTFTDVFSSSEKMLKQNAKSIAAAMKTWSGLMNLCMYDFRAIKSLIASLRTPSSPIRDTIIDLLYSLLRIKSPAWASTFLAGRRLTTYGRVQSLKSNTTTNDNTSYIEEDGGEQNFVEHYTALLLAILVKCGMIPALLQLTQETGYDNDNPTLKRKSTLLIGEVLKLASRLLPPDWSAELQLLPELFSAALNVNDDSHFVATGVIYSISSVSRTLFRSAPTSFTPASAEGKNMLEVLDEHHSRTNAATSYDGATFRQMVLESAVLTSANYTKWKWDTIIRIVEGPLTNGKRLEEAMNTSKFLKRLMSFYRPFKYRFSEVQSSRNTQKYVRAGCSLIHTLLQSPEGYNYLAGDKLVRQIAECLAQCDPTSGLTAQFPLFAPDRLTDTLCGGYFPMLGVLSSHPKGLRILDRWRFFNMMYHIIELRQRPDLVKLFLSNIDFSSTGHPRVVLMKALTSGSKDIRIYATDTLRKFALRPITAQDQEIDDFKWAIEILVSQLSDPEVEVCATAVRILEKACNTASYLEYIVECRPALDHLGEIGAPLLLRFLSSSIGYHYLDGLDYISNEMDDWFLGRNDSYVHVIEASLARAFVDHPEDPTTRVTVFEDERDAEVHSHVPPHFYRELTRTQEGCKLLRDKGHFDEFASTIRDYGMEAHDTETMIKVKGCMWAVGNVGSMDSGAEFLESSDVVQHIVDIAQNHEVLSLRGTAFFVIGLISRSVHGLEILSEHGWDANTNSWGTSLGFCIPTDLGKFFSVQPWKSEPIPRIALPDSQKTEIIYIPPVPSRPRSESLLKVLEAENDGNELPRAKLDPDPTNQRIMELVVDLANMVLYRKARNELMQIKQLKKAPGFKQPHLFRHVMALLETHHYRLADRSMVVGLFDKNVLRHIVFGEESDSEDSDKGGGVRDLNLGQKPPTPFPAGNIPPPQVPPRAPGRVVTNPLITNPLITRPTPGPPSPAATQQAYQAAQAKARAEAQAKAQAQERARARERARLRDHTDDEEEDDDDDEDEDEEDENDEEEEEEEDSDATDTGDDDDQKTERQRSISDPSEVQTRG